MKEFILAMVAAVGLITVGIVSMPTGESERLKVEIEAFNQLNKEQVEIIARQSEQLKEISTAVEEYRYKVEMLSSDLRDAHIEVEKAKQAVLYMSHLHPPTPPPEGSENDPQYQAKIIRPAPPAVDPQEGELTREQILDRLASLYIDDEDGPDATPVVESENGELYPPTFIDHGDGTVSIVPHPDIRDDAPTLMVNLKSHAKDN